MILEDLIKIAAHIDDNRKAVVQPNDLVKIPNNRRVYKPAAAAFIVPSGWRDSFILRLKHLPMLLGENAKTGHLEVIGGAVDSKEEQALAEIFQPFEGFTGPFYHLQALSLLTTGDMRQLTYTTKGGETNLAAALREVVEEGIQCQHTVAHQFQQVIEIPVPFKPSNPNLRNALEAKFPEMYGSTPGAAQIVQQYGFLVEIPDLQILFFRPNAEVASVQFIEAKDVVALAAKKAGLDHDSLNPALESKELRNSIPIHLLKWLIEHLIATDQHWNW